MVLRGRGCFQEGPKRDFGRQLQRNQWFPRARGNETSGFERDKSSGAGRRPGRRTPGAGAAGVEEGGLVSISKLLSTKRLSY